MHFAHTRTYRSTHAPHSHARTLTPDRYRSSIEMNSLMREQLIAIHSTVLNWFAFYMHCQPLPFGRQTVLCIIYASRPAAAVLAHSEWTKSANGRQMHVNANIYCKTETILIIVIRSGNMRRIPSISIEWASPETARAQRIPIPFRVHGERPPPPSSTPHNAFIHTECSVCTRATGLAYGCSGQ